MAKKVIKFLLYILVLYAGIVGLYLESGSYYNMGISDKEKLELANVYKHIKSGFTISDSNMLLSEGLVRRNYSYGYVYEYRNDKSFSCIVSDLEKQFISKGYDITWYQSKQKLKAVKGNYAIEVYKNTNTLLNYSSNSKDIYYIYIKPNDAFEWTYLDFGAFTIGNFWF